MGRRDYELPAGFVDAVNCVATLTSDVAADRSRDGVRAVTMSAPARYDVFDGPPPGETPAQAPEQALNHFAGECCTMIGENFKELGPVYRAAHSSNNPVQ